MILGEITPISPIAEHIMVMANEMLRMNYIKETEQLRKLLAGYKIVGPKNKIQSHKSYLKIIRGNQNEAIIIRGPKTTVEDYMNMYTFIYAHQHLRPC